MGAWLTTMWSEFLGLFSGGDVNVNTETTGENSSGTVNAGNNCGNTTNSGNNSGNTITNSGNNSGNTTTTNGGNNTTTINSGNKTASGGSSMVQGNPTTDNSQHNSNVFNTSGGMNVSGAGANIGGFTNNCDNTTTDTAPGRSSMERGNPTSTDNSQHNSNVFNTKDFNVTGTDVNIGGFTNNYNSNRNKKN